MSKKKPEFFLVELNAQQTFSGEFLITLTKQVFSFFSLFPLISTYFFLNFLIRSLLLFLSLYYYGVLLRSASQHSV